jgi:hypothetical protein
MPGSIGTLEILFRLLEIEHAKVPEGQVFDSYVRVTPAKLVHINLIEEKQSMNLPNDENTLIVFPYKQARKLVIQNRGPATLRWLINGKKGTMTAYNTLHENEGDNDHWWGFPLIRSLNLIADSPPWCNVEFSLRV